jgi:hypothetical protein
LVRFLLVLIAGLTYCELVLQFVILLLFLAPGTHTLNRNIVGFPRNDRGAPLLHDVRQFMGEQLLSLGTFRTISPVPKENILPGSKGDCVHGAVERVRFRASMNADSAEIRAERRLHLATH